MCPTCFPKPQADLVVPAPHRELLFGLIRGALRAEHGARGGRSMDYYAGRRSGFISAAGQLMATLYGGDYDAAKQSIREAVKATGQTVAREDLVEADTSRALAVTIAEVALRVI
jgi:hypothetical protein